MVIPDGLGHRGETGNPQQPLGTDLAMLVGLRPVDLVDEVPVDFGGGNTAVMEETGAENPVTFVLIEPQYAGAGQGHVRHSLAVVDFVNPDEVDGVRQGADELFKIDFHMSTTVIPVNGFSFHSSKASGILFALRTALRRLLMAVS
jgi:hypothetical protein